MTPGATEDFLASGDPTRALLVSPAVVVVGPGAVERLGAIASGLGRRALVIGGANSYPAARSALETSLQAAGLQFEVARYGQDCCEPDLDRLGALLRDTACDVVVGVGGGKALDAAKLVAHRAGVPVVTVPTSAATCAAWTALSNVYSPSGTWLYGVPLPTNPDAVIVDHTLVGSAPPRLLAAGIADSMAKWVESSASVDAAHADAMTLAALEMARFIFERLRQVGEVAFEQAACRQGGLELAQAIDANVQLAGTVGGMGGARCRSVVAHAVCNALTNEPGHERSLHGEKVAFGIVVQRLLQGFGDEQLTELLRFFAALGLPVTLAGLGVADDPSALERIAQRTVRPGSSAHLLPGGVRASEVSAALRRADALGRAQTPSPSTL